MGLVVLALIVICFYYKKARQKVFTYIITALIISALLYIVVVNADIVGPIILIGIIVLFILGYISSKIEDKKDQEAITIWLSSEPPQFTVIALENIMTEYAKLCQENDTAQRKYSVENGDIPYGRATCFLNYFDRSIENEEPLYYSPVRSKDDVELREYGYLLTSAGLYVSQQTDKTDDNNVRKVINIELPFSGMFKVSSCDEKEITIRYADMNKVTLKQNQISLPIATVNQIVSEIINNQISLAIYKNYINDTSTMPDDDVDYDDILKDADKNFKRSNNSNGINFATTNAGTFSSIDGIMDKVSDLGDRMNGAQGHGFAAEYANDTIDRITGKNAKIVGNDNAKNGADRVVNGINIQTKYCKTASDSVGAAFENGHAKYINPENGKMMVIEVPRDQYTEAIKSMAKRIDKGEVPGETNPDNAYKYVKKGKVTYTQSVNIAKAGTIDSLAIDLATGALECLAPGGVTALITFAMQIWNGAEPKEAAKSSIIVGLKVIGKGAIIYTVIEQLARDNADFGFKLINNIHYGIQSQSSKLASSISNSSLANTGFGQKMGLKGMTGKTVIRGGVIFVVSYGPDIARALVGRISPKQLFKNASVTTAGMIGARVIGQTIIPIPIVGSIIGGAVTGFVAKKVLDQFIEDDAVKMYQLLREEFIDVVMLSGLTSDEFNQVVTIVFENKKLDKILRDMYAYGDSRAYARENIVSVAVISVLQKREKITSKMVEKAYIDLAEDAAKDVPHEKPKTMVDKFCPMCGLPYKENGKFCLRCGAKRK